MTFTILVVSIEQNEEFQESRVHYTLAGIKSLLKTGEGWGGSLAREGAGPEPLEPSPGYPPEMTGGSVLLNESLAPSTNTPRKSLFVK